MHPITLGPEDFGLYVCLDCRNLGGGEKRLGICVPTAYLSPFPVIKPHLLRSTNVVVFSLAEREW